VFIANKKVFWAWILSPLLIRFVLVSGTYGLTIKYLDGFEQEKAYVSAAELIQPELDANDWLLKRYVQTKAAPVNERFYQLVADLNLKYEVNLNTAVDSDRSKNSLVVKYAMNLRGDIGTVYKASSYLVDILVDPLTSIQMGRLSATTSRAKAGETRERKVFLEAGFERLAFFESAGGVK
jgi:hypothetical protein